MKHRIFLAVTAAIAVTAIPSVFGDAPSSCTKQAAASPKAIAVAQQNARMTGCCGQRCVMVKPVSNCCPAMAAVAPAASARPATDGITASPKVRQQLDERPSQAQSAPAK